MRGWITPKRSYMPPIRPGDVMRAFAMLFAGANHGKLILQVAPIAQ